MKNLFLKILRNIPGILVSILIAIVIWIFAVSTSDPTEEGRFPQSVQIEMTCLEEGLILTNDLPYTVNINLRAPKSVWRRIELEKVNAKAVIDVSGLDEGEHEIPIKVNVGISPIQILSFTPSVATVHLERFETRVYPLTVKETGEVPTAFKADAPVLSDETVTVSGPVSQLDKIKEVRVVLDHKDATGPIEKNLSVMALSESSIVVKGITISPEKVNVTQNITMRGGYRVLSVKLLTSGEIQNGLRVTNIDVDPSYVTVYCSDRELLDSLPGYLETEPLDLSTVSESITQKIGISVPEGVTLVGVQSVNTTVDVEAIEGTKTLTDIPLTMIGEEEDLIYTVSPEAIDIYLSGPMTIVNGMVPESVKAVLDVKDLTPGSYQIEPEIEGVSDELIEVQTILPATIEVNIAAPEPEEVDVENEGEVEDDLQKIP